MNVNQTKRRVWLINAVALLALVLSSWAVSTGSAEATDVAERIAALQASISSPPAPAKYYLPVTQRSAEWTRVGDVPSGVTLFYEVAVCGQQGLAGTNLGLYSIGDVNGAQAVWQRQNGLGGGANQIVSGVTFVPGSNCATAYATSRTTGIWRGDRTGTNWQWKRVDKGLDESIAVLASADTLFVAGGYGVRWISPLPTNNQVTWNETGIDTITYSLTMSEQDASDIYAAEWQRGVSVKVTNAQWVLLSGIPNPNTYDAAANVDGTLIAGTDRGLVRFQNLAWTTTQPPFVNTSFAVLAVDDRFYAAHDGHGVIYSRDGGINWEWIGTGLPADATFRVRGLALGDGRLYAATRQGVWVWSNTP